MIAVSTSCGRYVAAKIGIVYQRQNSDRKWNVTQSVPTKARRLITMELTHVMEDCMQKSLEHT